MTSLRRHFFNLAELARGTAEFASFKAEWPQIRDAAPQGDGHSVLVLPPFTGHDIYSKPLRDALEEMGYNTHGWENGFNLGIQAEKMELVHQHLRKIYKENGNQKISVVGLSLGGIYARELARRFPHMIKCAVSINSPFAIKGNIDSVPGPLAAAIEMLSGPEFSLKHDDLLERLAAPPKGVPTTSIYSKTDGIAGWEACLNGKSPLAENIEVNGSHMGGFWNPAALAVLLDRLAQPEDGWKPYAAPKNPPGTDRRNGQRPFPN
jgi:hypothetical protein